MNFDRAKRLQRAFRVLMTSALIGALVGGLTGCATPPPAPVAATPPSPSRAERIATTLKAMNFEPNDDGWHLSLPAPLVFAFDSDVVAADARDNLIQVARELHALDVKQVLVRGHTDTVGATEYNMGLSKRRAEAVARVMGEGGYPVGQIDAKGLGSAAPIAENSTAEGRAKNRRVVIIVQVDVATPS